MLPASFDDGAAASALRHQTKISHHVADPRHAAVGIVSLIVCNIAFMILRARRATPPIPHVEHESLSTTIMRVSWCKLMASFHAQETAYLLLVTRATTRDRLCRCRHCPRVPLLRPAPPLFITLVMQLHHHHHHHPKIAELTIHIVLSLLPLPYLSTATSRSGRRPTSSHHGRSASLSRSQKFWKRFFEVQVC